jgi:hypothetical protein
MIGQGENQPCSNVTLTVLCLGQKNIYGRLCLTGSGKCSSVLPEFIQHRQVKRPYHLRRCLFIRWFAPVCRHCSWTKWMHQWSSECKCWYMLIPSTPPFSSWNAAKHSTFGLDVPCSSSVCPSTPWSLQAKHHLALAMASWTQANARGRVFVTRGGWGGM